jgi:hypothetical protein
LSCLNSETVADIAEEYAPILREALEDLDYDDYRLAARSLPQIATGFFSEVLSEQSFGRSWRCELGPHDHQLSPEELVKKLEALNTVARIGILDCMVAERHRRAANAIPIKKKRSAMNELSVIAGTSDPVLPALRPMLRGDVWRMVRRRASDGGIETSIGATRFAPRDYGLPNERWAASRPRSAWPDTRMRKRTGFTTGATTT